MRGESDESDDGDMGGKGGLPMSKSSIRRMCVEGILNVSFPPSDLEDLISPIRERHGKRRGRRREGGDAVGAEGTGDGEGGEEEEEEEAWMKADGRDRDTGGDRVGDGDVAEEDLCYDEGGGGVEACRPTKPGSILYLVSGPPSALSAGPFASTVAVAAAAAAVAVAAAVVAEVTVEQSKEKREEERRKAIARRSANQRWPFQSLL